VDHLSNIFKEENKAFITKVVRMETLFIRFFYEVDNESLMEKVKNEELHEVMNSFKKDKSHGLDG